MKSPIVIINIVGTINKDLSINAWVYKLLKNVFFEKN